MRYLLTARRTSGKDHLQEVVKILHEAATIARCRYPTNLNMGLDFMQAQSDILEMPSLDALKTSMELEVGDYGGILTQLITPSSGRGHSLYTAIAVRFVPVNQPFLWFPSSLLHFPLYCCSFTILRCGLPLL